MKGVKQINMMKTQVLQKILLPAGLISLSASFIIEHYVKLSDFTSGYIKGTVIGLLLGWFILEKIKRNRIKQSL